MPEVKRPRLLVILLLLVLAQAALYLAFAAQYGRSVQLLQATAEGWTEHGLANSASLLRLWLRPLTWGGLGAVSLVALPALRGGRTWAWTAALIIEGVIQVLALQAYFSGQGNELFYGAMALAVGITFLLNQREIRIFFHAHQPEQPESQFRQ